MFDLIPIIVGILSLIVAITLGIRTLRKRPFIFFQLFRKTEMTIANGKRKEKIALLSAPVGNKVRSFFGDTAKKTSVNVLYEARSQDGKVQVYAGEMPWLNTYGTRIEIKDQLENQKDIQDALEKHLFCREKRDIPQGRGEHLAVAYGIEKTNRLFLATKPPIEITLPSKQNRRLKMHASRLALEIAGENLSSTVSRMTMIIAIDWNNFTFPKKMELIYAPSRFRRILLRLGIGRETKILGSDSK